MAGAKRQQKHYTAYSILRTVLPIRRLIIFSIIFGSFRLYKKVTNEP